MPPLTQIIPSPSLEPVQASETCFHGTLGGGRGRRGLVICHCNREGSPRDRQAASKERYRTHRQNIVAILDQHKLFRDTPDFLCLFSSLGL